MEDFYYDMLPNLPREAVERGYNLAQELSAKFRAMHERQRALEAAAQAQAQAVAVEKDLSAARYKLERAEADIDFLQRRSAELYAQLDYALMQQAALIPGSKGFESLQRRIMSLENQIHATETRLAKAQYNKEGAQRKLL